MHPIFVIVEFLCVFVKWVCLHKSIVNARKENIHRRLGKGSEKEVGQRTTSIGRHTKTGIWIATSYSPEFILSAIFSYLLLLCVGTGWGCSCKNETPLYSLLTIFNAIFIARTCSLQILFILTDYTRASSIYYGRWCFHLAPCLVLLILLFTDMDLADDVLFCIKAW